MYEFMREFAALEPQPPELQQLFRTVHGNQAAMDGFGEYRSDFCRCSQKGNSVAATAESIQSVDFGSGVEPGRVLINPQRSLGASSPSSPAQSGTIMSGVR